ncbi:MAG TPA: serine protease [Caulobacteraceae bacterium]
MAVDLPVAMIAATVKIEQPQPGGNIVILGTGFLVNAPRPDGSPRTVLVTAGHVFDNMPGAVAYIDYRLPTPGGGWKYSPQPLTIRANPSLLWTKSPGEDVAVIAVQATPEFARTAIPLSWLADDASFAGDGVAPGDEMFALGFPDGLSANPEGFPILRTAHVASYPLVAMPAYPRFMLDMRVFMGESGGPVFLASPLQRRPGGPVAGTPYVTGLIAQAAPKYEWAFVIEAPVIRSAIARLDQVPAQSAPETSGGFTLTPPPPPPTSASAAADAKP